jgi:hypothetical protein
MWQQWGELRIKERQVFVETEALQSKQMILARTIRDNEFITEINGFLSFTLP